MLSPEEFIAYIDHCPVVVTNSFHGIAFSINFNKEFYTMYPSEKNTKANNRLKSILTLFELEDRLISSDISSYGNIKWCHVTSILSEQRDKSVKYIESILKEVSEI